MADSVFHVGHHMAVCLGPFVLSRVKTWNGMLYRHGETCLYLEWAFRRRGAPDLLDMGTGVMRGSLDYYDSSPSLF